MDGSSTLFAGSVLPASEAQFPLSRQTSLRQHAMLYRRNNWTPYRLSEKQKKPPGKKAANVVGDDNIDQLLNRDSYNLGVLLGSESDGLVDLDLDWPEAGVVGSQIFRDLPCFGRAGAPSSHRLARCPDSEKSLKFSLPSSVSDSRLPDAHKMTVLEVRASGHTMFPPSIHPNGEEVKWEKESTLPEFKWHELKRRAGLAAFLAVCIRLWPQQGSRDETAMALASVLLAAGLDVGLADRAAIFVATSANDEEADKRGKAGQTSEKLEKQEPVTGMTSLVTLLGLPSECINVFHKWLQTKTKAEGQPIVGGEVTDDGVLILDLAAPRKAAREFITRVFTFEGHRSIVFHQGEYFIFDKGRYRSLELTALQNSIYEFLETSFINKDKQLKQIKPRKQDVDAIEHALRSLVLIEKDILQPPCWITGEGSRTEDLVVCHNGIFALDRGVLLPLTARLFTLNALDICYDPNAAQPERWLSFLREVFPEDPESVSTLQEMMGYLLTPQTRQQKVFMFVAPPRSGKGTIARVVEQLVGKRNYAGIYLGSLGDRFGLEPLIGKLVAVVTDARLGSKSDKGALVEKVLSISGEDSVQVDRKNKPYWGGRLPTRFFIHTNEVPTLPDASGAFVSRFVVLTTRVSFLGREDHDLRDKLTAELPGILLWAIEGWRRLNERGRFVQPDSAAEILNMFANVSSPIKAFVNDVCVLDPGVSCGKDAMFEAWRRWSEEQGRGSFMTKDQFCAQLYAAVPQVKPGKGSRSEGRPPELRGICPAADLPPQGDLIY